MTPLNVKPLITYTFEALRNSCSVQNSMVICSSDDPLILNCANTYYNDIFLHQRSPNLSRDTSSMHELVLTLEKHYNLAQPYDICILQPTSPLRTANDIDATF